MGDISVKKKLVSGFLIVALFCMICSGVGLFSVSQYRTLTEYMSGIIMRTHASMLEMACSVGDSRQHNYEAIIYPDEIQENINDEKQLHARSIAMIDEIGALSDILKGMAIELKDLYVTANNSQTNMFNMIAAGEFDISNPEHAKILSALDDDWDAVQAFVIDAAVILEGYGDMLTEKEAALNTLSTILLSVVSILSILAAVGIAFLNINSIVKPTQEVAKILENMAETGDLRVNLSDDLRTRKDEFGDMGRSFANAMDMMQGSIQVLERVADGDLSVDIKIRSADDAIAIALRSMVEQMNNLFKSITNFSEQIAAGSRQISDGSQSLAQGTTEQASAIEELSASIAHIAGQTIDTAKQVNEASTLASGIRDNAEQSNVKMRQLVDAVREIDVASNSISRIIKVIDDIAFQTNLLALNASVEAAHAGIHGQGFAVVADEVKNLAMRSANAAKDTTELIENSIQKAVEGVNIAKEAESALGEIVTGIEDAAAIISKIADASTNEADALKQVNAGVEQVSQVVQLNSATSEEAASASAELTGIAQNLQEMMGVFRLNGSALASGAARSHKALPAPPYRQEKVQSAGASLGKY